MRPTATPPNAVVFASRYITIPQMARAGLWLNLLGFVTIVTFVAKVGAWIWDIERAHFPDAWRH